jgi:hypothetical protein
MDRDANCGFVARDYRAQRHRESVLFSRRDASWFWMASLLMLHPGYRDHQPFHRTDKLSLIALITLVVELQPER